MELLAENCFWDIDENIKEQWRILTTTPTVALAEKLLKLRSIWSEHKLPCVGLQIDEKLAPDAFTISKYIVDAHSEK